MKPHTVQWTSILDLRATSEIGEGAPFLFANDKTDKAILASFWPFPHEMWCVCYGDSYWDDDDIRREFTHFCEVTLP